MSEHIKREDALKTLIDAIHNDGFAAESGVERRELREDEIEDAINAIPAADVEPVVRATWVEKQIKNYNKYYPDGFRCTSMYTCSNCGRKSKTKHARCLHCFAHMERSGSDIATEPKGEHHD